MSFTHITSAGQPTMVDVGEKPVTQRTAVAQCRVEFPAQVAAQLRQSGYIAKKGPIIDTAIIAGVMAAKRTHDLIPFCHPLAIERCNVRVEADGDALRVECEVAVTGKTGVEMEALTGASVAALTIYDMCKALSHEILITGLALVAKRGGQRDVGALPA
jgi:cyclic pyranopterin monophosphate synthase